MCTFVKVHIRVASPPVKHPCYMGINIPTKEELIANRVELHRLASYFGANSVVYLSVDGLKTAVMKGIQNKDTSSDKSQHCTACLTGEYPVELSW